jgi:nucleotide-binding universal stress UspA family protein
MAQRHPKTNCELLTRIGDPAHEILAAERRLTADLIVLATHGRKGMRRMLLGGVVEARAALGHLPRPECVAEKRILTWSAIG